MVNKVAYSARVRNVSLALKRLQEITFRLGAQVKYSFVKLGSEVKMIPGFTVSPFLVGLLIDFHGALIRVQIDRRKGRVIVHSPREDLVKITYRIAEELEKV